MSNSGASCLGVCYAENQLFYSVNNPGRDARLERIGCIDFNVNIEEAITTGNTAGFPALKSSLEELQREYDCSSVKILAPALHECWTIVPRAVYEDASEREAHIQLLMKGLNRKEIQTEWHPVSNADCRLLLLRDRSYMQGVNSLLHSFADSEYVAEFELGYEWQLHTRNRGAFLMLHCHRNYISVTSFILGKLRGCTYIEFDDIADLPYLWNLYAGKLPWMQGLHDSTFLFGPFCSTVEELMAPHLHDHGTLCKLNSLSEMNVQASESTYGFRLENAFPAILMSLNKDSETTAVNENYNR